MRRVLFAVLILVTSGCATLSDAERAAAQEDAVLRAWDKEPAE